MSTAKVIAWTPPYCCYTADCIERRTPPTHVVVCDYGNGAGNRMNPMCETCARKCARHLRAYWKEHAQ